MSDFVSGTIVNACDATFDLTKYYGDWEGERPKDVLAPGETTGFGAKGIISANASAVYKARGTGVVLDFRINSGAFESGKAYGVYKASQEDVFNVYTRRPRSFAVEFMIKNWPE